MKYSKNILATAFICTLAPTICFAITKASIFTLNGNSVEVKTDKKGTWVLLPKNFEIGTLINESNRKLKLTEENFNKANKIGNSYKEVCKILGGEGELQFKSVDKDLDDEKRVHTSYSWEDGSVRVYMQFKNGKITDTMFNDWEQNLQQSGNDIFSFLEKIQKGS